jgi:hypothetical protein
MPTFLGFPMSTYQQTDGCQIPKTQALIRGHTVLFTSADQLLSDLSALDSDSALRRRLRHYVSAHRVIDEVGHLSYSNAMLI